MGRSDNPRSAFQPAAVGVGELHLPPPRARLPAWHWPRHSPLAPLPRTVYRPSSTSAALPAADGAPIRHLCVCVVLAYTNTPVHVHTCRHRHTHRYTYTHAHSRASMHTHGLRLHLPTPILHTHTCTHVCIHVCTHTHSHMHRAHLCPSPTAQCTGSPMHTPGGKALPFEAMRASPRGLSGCQAG